MPDDQKWYAVMTQPAREATAREYLLQRGVAAYLPQYRRTVRHARRVESVLRPLFPRYLFVGLDLSRDRWRSVNSTPGVQTLIMCGDRPGEVPRQVLDAIRQREAPDGSVLVPAPQLDRGALVRITDGALKDHTGLFERISDHERVAILLKMLGSDIVAFVPNRSVTAA